MYTWIGTSGYSYRDWVGDFYPEGTSPGRMLSHYCGYFPLVELNFTFYKLPTRGTLTRLADKTPSAFQFLVKVPQTISHEQNPLDLPGFRHAVEGLAQRGQLSGILIQFPQAMHCTGAACHWITTLTAELGHLGLFFEFRHRSWYRKGLADWLAEKNAGLVAVDAPDLPGLFPSGWVQAGNTAYIRLHSRNGGKWYEGGVERYDYDYTDDELGEWITEMIRRDQQGETQNTLLLFNNCNRGQAAVNARRMQSLLGTQAPQLNLVPPFATPRPVQKTLFAD